MNTEQADLMDSVRDARRRGAVEPLDAWFADGLDDVEQALGFADHVLNVMEAPHFSDYDIGSVYLQVFEDFFTAGSPHTVGQSRIADFGGDN